MSRGVAAGLLLAALAVGIPAGCGPAGCGPVVAPADDAGAPDADASPRPDICQRPDAPDVCTAGFPDRSTASTCAGGAPDGRCVPALEDCSCLDCALAARCFGVQPDGGDGGPIEGGAEAGCANDDKCDPGQGEDCSCDDCFGKVKGCAPSPVGCVDNGVCNPLEDDCTCPDCRLDRDCQGCVTNGDCIEYSESCVCADCASSPRCQPH